MNQDSSIYHHNQNSVSNSMYQGQNGTPPSKQRVKDIISTTQNTFDKMKKDMVEKELQIEEKNREILKLRMQNEEMMQRFSRQGQPG